MKRSFEQIIALLEKQGLVFSHCFLRTEGNYTPEDAVWNYKDAPAHIPHVHHLAQDTPVTCDEEGTVAVYVQRLLGFRFPMLLAAYEREPNTITAVTSWLFFVLVTHHEYEEIADLRTRDTVNYFIGAPRGLRWMIPLLRWMITRNHRVLDGADIPIRERRGQLRSWGYTFAKSSFTSTLNIHTSNAVPPKVLPAVSPVSLRVDEELPRGSSYLVGRSDHVGLRILRSDGELLFFQRMCDHEGANLDLAKCVNGRIRCPWHGRVVPPSASIDLTLGTTQTVATAHHEIRLEDGILTIRYATGDEASPPRSASD